MRNKVFLGAFRVPGSMARTTFTRMRQLSCPSRRAAFQSVASSLQSWTRCVTALPQTARMVDIAPAVSHRRLAFRVRAHTAAKSHPAPRQTPPDGR